MEGTSKLEAADSTNDLLESDTLAEMFPASLFPNTLPKTEPAKEEAVEVEAAPVVEEKAPPAEPEKVEPTKAEPATKEEEVKAEPAKEEPPLLTKFQVFDKEGELEVPRDLTFSFTANKKEYKDIPLDKVVLLAQMGFYNEEREERVKEAEAFKPVAEQTLNQYAQAIQKLTGEYANIFEDPSYYEAARAAYFEENSPDKRAARAEQQVQVLQTSQRQAAEQAEAATYVATVLTPAVEDLLKTNPLVSYEEVMGRMQTLTAPLVASSTPVRHRLAETKRLVETELTQWVRGKHLERDVAQRTKDAQIVAEKTKTTLAKRQVARSVQPRGAPAPATIPTKVNFDSARDWLDSILPQQVSED